MGVLQLLLLFQQLQSHLLRLLLLFFLLLFELLLGLLALLLLDQLSHGGPLLLLYLLYLHHGLIKVHRVPVSLYLLIGVVVAYYPLSNIIGDARVNKA